MLFWIHGAVFRFVLSYEEDGIKFYPNYSKLLSLYYDFNPDVDPRKFSDVLYKGSVSQDYYGKFKEDEVDDIILQEYPMRVNLSKLPDDVEMVVEGGGDDEDHDRGGGRLPTMKETLEKRHDAINEIDEEESEESEKKSFKGLFLDKPKDEHDGDNDEGFVTPPVGSRKISDDYRIELAKLENEKEKLMETLKVKRQSS